MPADRLNEQSLIHKHLNPLRVTPRDDIQTEDLETMLPDALRDRKRLSNKASLSLDESPKSNKPQG